MAKQTLNNNVSFGEQRGKINDNFTELYDALGNKVDKETGKGLVSNSEKGTWNNKQDKAPTDGKTYGLKDGSIIEIIPTESAVASVNGQTGAVALTTDNIAQTTTKQYVSDTEKTNWNGASIGSDLGLLKTTDTPPATGKHKGDVATAGTYTNFITAGATAVVFTAPELVDNFGYIYVVDNVATKSLVAKKGGSEIALTTVEKYPKLPFTLIKNKWTTFNGNGVIIDKSGSAIIDVDITGVKEFTVSGIVVPAVGYYGYAFYDASNTVLASGAKSATSLTIVTSTAGSTEMIKPAGATRFVVDVTETNASAFTEANIKAFKLTYIPDEENQDITKINNKELIAKSLKGVSSLMLDYLKNSTLRVVSDNILNRSGEMIDFGIGNNGQIIRKVGYSVVTFRADENQDYALYPLFTTTNWRLVYLTESLDIISITSENNSTATPKQILFTTPLGTRFISTELKNPSVYNNPDLVTIQKYNKNEFNLKPYDKFKLKIGDETSIVTKKENLIQEKYVTAYNFTTGVLTLEYPVIGGQWFSQSGITAEAVATDTWIEYDVDNVEILRLRHKPGGVNFIFRKTNANTKKIKVTISTGGLNKSIKEIAQSLFVNISTKPYLLRNNYNKLLKYKEFDVNVPYKEVDKLKGITIVTFGDSITSNGSTSSDGPWPLYIQQKAPVMVVNYARGSALFSNRATTDNASLDNTTVANNVVSVQVRQMIAAGIVPDIVVLTGGTNDASATLPIGSFATAIAQYPTNVDSLDLQEFYNVAIWAIAKLKAVNPYVEIYFATPIRALFPSLMIRLQLYVEGFNDLSKKMGIPLIDFYNCGIIEYPVTENDNFNGGGATDVLHPSQKGVEIMGAFALQKILTTYRKRTGAVSFDPNEII